MTPSRTLELLAPCKTCDIGIEAFKHGADAVYIGGPLFSARANAGNSMSEIERLASFAHRFNGRVYMALNTIFSDEERLRGKPDGRALRPPAVPHRKKSYTSLVS